MVLTTEQKAFLVESYFRNGSKIDGRWVYSVADCRQELSEMFPDVIMDENHFKCTLNRCIKLFRESGSVIKKNSSGRPPKRTAEVVETARQIMEEQPRTPIRHLAQQVDLSVGTCHSILHKELHLHPYRITSVQELLPVDIPRRLNFCRWFLDTFNQADSLRNVFFTDESWFYRTGYINSQNMRIWCGENPHELVETTLHPDKIGVWAAISQRRIIGPIFFEGK